MSLPERAKRSSLEFSLQFLRINDQWSSRLSRFWKELVHRSRLSVAFDVVEQLLREVYILLKRAA